jgi:hypothetical protein
MVHNTLNYWVFGLRPSSSILETRKHDVLETRSVSVVRWGREISSFYGTQQSRCLLLHPRTETDPVSETLCSLVSTISDDGRNPKTQLFCGKIYLENHTDGCGTGIIRIQSVMAAPYSVPIKALNFKLRAFKKAVAWAVRSLFNCPLFVYLYNFYDK